MLPNTMGVTNALTNQKQPIKGSSKNIRTHTKYKTYQVDQIISYSTEHYHFLSTAYLAIAFSYYLPFIVPVSVEVRYLSVSLFL